MRVCLDVWGCQEDAVVREKQILCEDDNKKDKSKSNDKCKGKR